MAFNILVVDDSETMRSAIKKVVAMAGIPVGNFYEAGDGKEALKVVEDQWVDVILSDIIMPEMNGIEFLRILKQNEVHANVPVIFITTESSEARMEEAKEMGVAGYIKKPFVPETIKKILYEVLSTAYEQPLRMDSLEHENDEDMDF
jgi:two-component system chemotaxis response regulator CheY